VSAIAGGRQNHSFAATSLRNGELGVLYEEKNKRGFYRRSHLLIRRTPREALSWRMTGDGASSSKVAHHSSPSIVKLVPGARPIATICAVWSTSPQGHAPIWAIH
jgi:hypothetical protein